MAWRIHEAVMAGAILFAGAGSVHAEGIAFVQAPEQGSGVAVGETMEAAFAAAVAQCMESGAYEEDCIRTNWCEPAGFSIDIFVQHQEGLHWHEVVCGLPTETIARATAVHMCDRTERDYLIECSLAQVYDQAGTALMEW
ncbi:hypothetical protein [Roseitalea porphyridii]|uniref:hypothetical protein n=1 Tax=Roseitalea porphyridii TaxID=1852022 RepID=UPI001863D326|nr:hypothetical protein [Roseitalea porphyridii]